MKEILTFIAFVFIVRAITYNTAMDNRMAREAAQLAHEEYMQNTHFSSSDYIPPLQVASNIRVQDSCEALRIDNSPYSQDIYNNCISHKAYDNR